MIEAVLGGEASLEARRAWIHGNALLDTPRRLHIFVSGLAVGPEQMLNPLADSKSAIWQEMYKRSSDYWRGESREDPAASFRWTGLL